MSMTDCPRGHKLPHEGETGQCTPLRCAALEEQPRVDHRTKLEKVATKDRFIARTKAESVPKSLAKADSIVASMKAARATREQLVSVPEGLEGDAAEAWTVRKLADLAPYAAAQLEYDLLYGTDRTRTEAAKDVLDRTGHGKRGDAGGMGGPVVIVRIDNGGALPWAPKSKVIDAEAKSATVDSRDNVDGSGDLVP